MTTVGQKMLAPASPDLVSIQIMRGVAATLVVIFHIGTQFGSIFAPVVLEVAHALQAGVDIFFIISGFIMWHIYVLKKPTPGSFILSRLIRIVPLYWFATTLVLLLSLAVPNLRENEPIEVFHLLGSYLFLPIPRQSNGELWPIILQGWTLNYEMLFYAIFAFAIVFRPVISLLVVTLSFLLIHALTLVLPVTAQHEFYGSSILFEFLLGIALAHAYNKGVRFSRSVGFAILITGVLILALSIFFADLPRFFKWGIASLMVVAGLVLQPGFPKSKSVTLIARIGDASYSIYLFHFILVYYTYAVFERVPGAFGSSLGTAFAAAVSFLGILILSLLTGYFMFRFFELPVTRYLRRLLLTAPRKGLSLKSPALS